MASYEELTESDILKIVCLFGFSAEFLKRFC